MSEEKKVMKKEYTIKLIPSEGGDIKSIHLSANTVKYGAISLAAGAMLFVGAFSYSVYCNSST